MALFTLIVHYLHLMVVHTTQVSPGKQDLCPLGVHLDQYPGLQIPIDSSGRQKGNAWEVTSFSGRPTQTATLIVEALVPASRGPELELSPSLVHCGRAMVLTARFRGANPPSWQDLQYHPLVCAGFLQRLTFPTWTKDTRSPPWRTHHQEMYGIRK